VRQCTRCRSEEALPGQRWGRACFALYRRQERLEKREAKGKARALADLAPRPRQAPGEAMNPISVIVRFSVVRLALLPRPEDVAVLERVRTRMGPGPHGGEVFIQREKR
jgi:hypothetical protein